MKRRTVVITGASAGVGRATVRAFAKQGARIGLIARGAQGLEGARHDVEKLGGEALILPLDVSDHAAVEAAAGTVEDRFGPIDVWVNNAMVSEYAPVWDITPDEFRHIVEVTFLGQVYGTMAALRRMRPRNRGSIVYVGSALAHRSIPLQSAYCASKHAVYGFVESLRTELLHTKSKVKVSIVELPGVNTPQFEWTRNKTGHEVQPVGPIYQPEVAADAILFAADSGRKEVLVGVPTVEAVLGERISPELMDRYIARTAWSGALEGPRRGDHSDNFWKPIPRDYGAHGRFDRRARSSSAQLWLTRNRGLVSAVVVAALATAFISLRPRE